MTRYLLDATFLIDYLRDLPAAIDTFERLFEAGHEVYVSEIPVCEVASGLRIDPDPALIGLLEQLEFVQPHYDVALRAGQLRVESRRVGRTLSLPDALIAAAALADDAVILTRNVRDFAQTPARIESY